MISRAWMPIARLAAILALVAPAAAGPPTDLRCYFGSTHAHCWLESGGDDGGFRTDVARKQAEKEPREDSPRRAFRKARPELYRGGTPEEAFRYARERGGLDFLALTIHDHMALPEEYAAIREAGAGANRRYEGRFCALFGQEWSTISTGNHVNILGAAQLCDAPKGRYDLLYGKWLGGRAEAPVVVLNHPFRARGELDRSRSAAHRASLSSAERIGGPIFARAPRVSRMSWVRLRLRAGLSIHRQTLFLRHADRAQHAPGGDVRATALQAYPKVAQEIVDLDQLADGLKNSRAVGLFEKVKLKSAIDVLIGRLKAFHGGARNYTLTQLQEQYDLLMMRIAAQLQDKDLPLHGQLCNAWQPLWDQLADRGSCRTRYPCRRRPYPSGPGWAPAGSCRRHR